MIFFNLENQGFEKVSFFLNKNYLSNEELFKNYLSNFTSRPIFSFYFYKHPLKENQCKFKIDTLTCPKS